MSLALYGALERASKGALLYQMAVIAAISEQLGSRGLDFAAVGRCVALF